MVFDNYYTRKFKRFNVYFHRLSSTTLDVLARYAASITLNEVSKKQWYADMCGTCRKNKFREQLYFYNRKINVNQFIYK